MKAKGLAKKKEGFIVGTRGLEGRRYRSAHMAVEAGGAEGAAAVPRRPGQPVFAVDAAQLLLVALHDVGLLLPVARPHPGGRHEVAGLPADGARPQRLHGRGGVCVVGSRWVWGCECLDCICASQAIDMGIELLSVHPRTEDWKGGGPAKVKQHK